MTGSAFFQQNFVLQRAHQVMIVILHAVLHCDCRHMAVGAAEHGGMFAVSPGFQFRMLRLEHLCSGSRLFPVEEAHCVIIGQDRLRRHFRLAVVRHHGFAVFRREIVFNMALSAGQRRRLDFTDVRTQRLIHILVGDNHLAAVAVIRSMTGITGDRLCHLSHDLVKSNGIDADAQFLNHLVHIRRLAGQAVGLWMRPLCLCHIRQGVGMSAGAAIILCKPISFINVHQIRILFQIICHITVFLFFTHRNSDKRQHIAAAYRGCIILFLGFFRRRLCRRFIRSCPAARHLCQDLLHGFLHGTGRELQSCAGDGIRSRAAALQDRLGPLLADGIRQQVVVSFSLGEDFYSRQLSVLR